MQHDAAFNIGYFIGSLIAAVIPLVFIVIPAYDLKRHGSNRNCLISLILVLSGYFIMMTTTIVSRGSEYAKVLNAIGFLLYLGLLLGSVVLAILGLAEYTRRRFVRGRASAIVALCLSGLPIFAGIVALGVAASRGLYPAGGGLTEAQQPFISKDLNFQCLIPPPWFRTASSNADAAICITLSRAARFEKTWNYPEIPGNRRKSPCLRGVAPPLATA
jgi:hypothetical protein